MPWTAAEATKHSRKADTPEKRRQWADVADSELERGASDAAAIRAADAVVARRHIDRGHTHVRNPRGHAEKLRSS